MVWVLKNIESITQYIPLCTSMVWVLKNNEHVFQRQSLLFEVISLVYLYTQAVDLTILLQWQLRIHHKSN